MALSSRTTHCVARAAENARHVATATNPLKMIVAEIAETTTRAVAAMKNKAVF